MLVTERNTRRLTGKKRMAFSKIHGFFLYWNYNNIQHLLYNKTTIHLKNLSFMIYVHYGILIYKLYIYIKNYMCVYICIQFH